MSAADGKGSGDHAADGGRRDKCTRHLINATRLQLESISDVERRRNRYADEIPAASVITFNTQSAAQAASDFLLMMGGLIDAAAPTDYLRVRPQSRKMEPVVPLPNSSSCLDCGTVSRSRLARGDSFDLPLLERSSGTGRSRSSRPMR